MQQINNNNKTSIFLSCLLSSTLMVTGICVAAETAAPATTVIKTTTSITAPATTPTAASMDESKVIKWGEEVALTAFTYNYENYQKRLEKLSEYFTAQGWEAYTKALRESNNLESVKKQQIDVTAKTTGSSKILEQRGNKEMHAWKMQIPVQVTYKNPRGEMQQNLIVELAITTGAKVANSAGLGILQFVAKPDK